MSKIFRIGTRDSELAVWQATQVQQKLQEQNISSELVFIKSEGDKDLITPLYALGVQGIFTKTLDAALLNNRIDIAVHSMKDVPVQLAKGIQQAAVLKRGNWKDIFVFGEHSAVNGEQFFTSRLTVHSSQLTIATSSVRRIAQWLHRYPNSAIENLRGNVNTRLRKLNESNWSGAIFAAAGLERINLRPANAMDLDWMLPAPTQGAIMIVCRTNDEETFKACYAFNDEATAICTKIEKDFLKELMGGCSTPIAALAKMSGDKIIFKGNILSLDGKDKAEVNKTISINDANDLGKTAAQELLNNGGKEIAESIRNAKV
ncbi:MAG TPA: hydroxymethylbilane synthase [Parafilimonas sp.]|nr:hydroxymethylbilane synthase [Parafilimonas sp.]